MPIAEIALAQKINRVNVWRIKKKFEKDLRNILEFVEKLKEVDTKNTEPTAQITGRQNITRPDEVKKTEEQQRKQILKNAPETKDGYIKVKAVFE